MAARSGDGFLGLVLTFDLPPRHTAPAAAIDAIRRALHRDGTWLVKDIRCTLRPQDNLRNPVAAMMYAFSVTSCMGRFRVIDVEDPADLYYEIRR